MANDTSPTNSDPFAPTPDSPTGLPRLVSTTAAESETDVALDVLRRTIERFSGQRRVLNTAGLKAELLHVTAGGFNERRLGFPSFRAFLQEAVRQGIVELRPQPGVDDFLVMLPGVMEAPARSEEATTRRRRPRIRQDIWRAFVEWKGGDTRLYDVEQDTAVTFPSRPVPLEPPEVANLRQRWESKPEAFRAIIPIPMQTQLAWMRQFTDRATEGDVRDLLLAALESERPARAFVGVLRSLPEQGEAWRDELANRVLEVIRQWAASNGLNIDPLRSKDVARPPAGADSVAEEEPSFQEPPRAGLADSAVRSNLGGKDAEAAFRRRLHQTLDRMPLHELLQLHLPVGYMLDE